MKRVYLIIFIICLLNPLKGFTQDAAYLEANNIRAYIPSGVLFSTYYEEDGPDGPGFEAPAGSGLGTMFVNNLWIAGLNENNNIHESANTFLFYETFQPGPIMDQEEYSLQTENWNRVWKVTSAEMELHISEYASAEYEMPESIANWPAHGDPDLGQAEDLAPFIDANSNGFYDPENGDYPQVSGNEAIYFIFNDDLEEPEAGTNPLSVEIHVMAYSFNCSTDSALDNTIFVNYRIINRSSVNYSDAYLGVFTDFDIGRALDDYLGSDVARGAFYGYNGDGLDDVIDNTAGYDEYLPAQATVFLGGPKQDPDGTDNPLTSDVLEALDNNGIVYEGQGVGFGDGIIDNERIGLTNFLNLISYMEPNFGLEAEDYYFAMQSVYEWTPDWSDIIGNVEPKMMFPGDSDPLFYSTNGEVVDPWTETTVENMPGDRRGIGSSGPFTFESGSEEELDLAFVFARSYESPGDNWAPVEIMKERIDDIRSYYLENQTPCGNSIFMSISESELVNFSLFPNPAANSINIQLDANLSENNSWIIYDSMGRQIQSGNLRDNFSSIDIASLAAGMYVFSIIDDAGVSAKRFIVGK